jgi:hypothetical protein
MSWWKHLLWVGNRYLLTLSSHMSAWNGSQIIVTATTIWGHLPVVVLIDLYLIQWLYYLRLIVFGRASQTTYRLLLFKLICFRLFKYVCMDFIWVFPIKRRHATPLMLMLTHLICQEIFTAGHHLGHWAWLLLEILRLTDNIVGLRDYRGLVSVNNPIDLDFPIDTNNIGRFNNNFLLFVSGFQLPR